MASHESVGKPGHGMFQGPRLAMGFLTAGALVWLVQALWPQLAQPLPAAAYLPLHTALEAVSVIMAAITFELLWRVPADGRKAGLMALAAALAGAAILDFVHMLSFPGMPKLITPAGADKAIDFWLLGRAWMVAGLLAMAWLPVDRAIGLRGRARLLQASAGGVALASLLVLGWPEALPAMFVAGRGLATLKVALEWALIALLVVAGVRLQIASRRHGLPPLSYLAAAAALAALGELCFASYHSVSDTLNLLGHVCKVAAYWEMLRAAFHLAVRGPLASIEDAQRLHALLQAAPDGVVVIDEHGRIRLTNPQVERMFGWHQDELVGADVAVLMPSHEASAHAGYVERFLVTGERRITGTGRDLVGQRRDGSALHLHVTLGEARLPAGRVFIAFLRDISERMRAAEDLAEREARYRTLMDTACDGICIVDRGGHLVAVNDAYVRMSGYGRDELLRMHVADLDERRRSADTRAHVERLVAHGSHRFETTHRAKDGRLWPVEVSAVYWPHGGGQYFAFLRDLTERRAAERALRAGEHKLRRLFELSPVGIALSTVSGALVEFNEAYQRLTGRDAGELRTLTHWDLMPAEYRAAGLRQQASLSRGDRYGPCEVEFLRPDGSRVPVRCNGVRLEIEGQAYVWSIVEDLSETRRIEAERQEMQRRELQSQKLQALGHLSGGVAHDFNNMLAGIIGLASLGLERHVDDPAGKLAAYLREIVRTGERGRDLVARMLRFARSEQQAPARPRDIAPLVADLREMLSTSLASGIALRMSAPAQLPAVRIAAADAQQVLMNLVINARDAIGAQGSIDVRLGVRQLEGQACAACGGTACGAHVVLEVQDDGQGIPAEVMPRIFDPFFTTKPVGKGSGLGLPSVLGIVHDAGGHLQVETAPGHGTLFRVLLPAAGPADAPGEAVPDDSAMPALPRTAAPVWVVDDDEVVLLCVTELLKAHGYDVRAFREPQAALNALLAGAGAPAALITDQTMPGLSGSELAAQALQRHPSLVVILCSGYREQADAERARDSGVRRFLSKPFDSRELLEALAADLQQG